MTSRKKPGVAFWATVVLVVVLVGYPLSVGPACWITSRIESEQGVRVVTAIYRPLVKHSPLPIRHAITRYAELGSPTGWMWINFGEWHWEQAFF